jgi:hypothetical protein
MGMHIDMEMGMGIGMGMDMEMDMSMDRLVHGNRHRVFGHKHGAGTWPWTLQ